MAVVFIPALLRDLTGGRESVTLPGETVRQVLDALDAQYPGVKARLCEQDQLRPGISVIVDGEVSAQRLRHRLRENSEVHFLAAVSGG